MCVRVTWGGGAREVIEPAVSNQKLLAVHSIGGLANREAGVLGLRCREYNGGEASADMMEDIATE